MVVATAEKLQLDPLLEQQLLVSVIPETSEDLESRRKAGQFIGACLTRSEVDLSFAETSQTVRPIESLHDAIQLAAEGNVAARKMVSINVATDVIERTTKSGHIMEVELNVDEAGRIQQHGQYIESVHANSLRYASGSEQMLSRTKAEATNAFRIADAYKEGKLEDYYFVVLSRAADDMSEQAMKDAGFFVDTMSVAIQVTSARGSTLTTESAFVAGKASPTAERHDAQTIAAMGSRLNVNLEGLTATKQLDTPLLIHKSVMPRGAIDFVQLYDACASEVCKQDMFFGERRDVQDYQAYREQCREREARFQPKVDTITERLIAEAGSISGRLQASERLHQLSQDQMVQQAAFDRSIDPLVFGGVASAHIIEARIEFERGNSEQALTQVRQAQKTAVSSSCPTGKNTEADQQSADEEVGDCEFVSKECPKCHAKNVKTKVSKGKITGSCGCSAKTK